MRALRSTGQTASGAGQRLADDAAGEGRGRLVRLARPHDDGRQAQRAAVDEALAALVVDQQFADRLLDAVGGLRRQRRLVGQGRRHVAAEDGDRAGEDDPRRPRQGAAGFEHRHACRRD